MIEKSIVKGLVEEWLEGRDYFLVDVSVSADRSGTETGRQQKSEGGLLSGGYGFI